MYAKLICTLRSMYGLWRWATRYYHCAMMNRDGGRIMCCYGVPSHCHDTFRGTPSGHKQKLVPTPDATTSVFSNYVTHV